MCRTAARHLHEARGSALELLYELELRRGQQRRIIPELTAVLAEEPIRESLYSLTMLALYRAGRQAEALELYRQLRVRLDEDLGINPSPTLALYEEAILRHDPLLMSADREQFEGRAGLPRTRTASAGWRPDR